MIQDYELHYLNSVSDLEFTEKLDDLPLYMNCMEEHEEADVIQPLSASSKKKKKLRHKSLATQGVKSHKMGLSEDFEEMGLGMQEMGQPVALQFENRGVANLLSLTQMESSEQEEFKIESKMARSMQEAISTPFSVPLLGSIPSPPLPPPSVLPQTFGSPVPPRQFDPPIPRSGQDLMLDAGPTVSLPVPPPPIPPHMSLPVPPPIPPPASPFQCHVPSPPCVSLPVPPPPPIPSRSCTSLTGSFGSTQFDPCKFYPHFGSTLDSSRPPLPLSVSGTVQSSGLYSLQRASFIKCSSTQPSHSDVTEDFLEEDSFPSGSSDDIVECSSLKDRNVPHVQSYFGSRVPETLSFRRLKATGKSIRETLFETETNDTLAETQACKFLKKEKPCNFASGSSLQAVGGTVHQSTRRSSILWATLFSLQSEDGFWKLTPELGHILSIDTTDLHDFLEQKGIRSLGIKGRECLLNLIATLLVLQFLRSQLEQDKIIFKSLMKLDDPSISRDIPWDFEAVKKASEWVRRMEGRYPSICKRLELGENWDVATKHLLGVQPPAYTSLHRVLCSSHA